MEVKEAVKYVADRFSYRADPKVFDYWSVMLERNKVMTGDCDDFALTSIWKICDKSILKFIVNVMILHRYRIYFSKTMRGGKHAVGYANGLWFDNWSKEALPEEEFLQRTKHTVHFFFPLPLMILPLFLGLFARYRKIN